MHRVSAGGEFHATGPEKLKARWHHTVTLFSEIYSMMSLRPPLCVFTVICVFEISVYCHRNCGLLLYGGAEFAVIRAPGMDSRRRRLYGRLDVGVQCFSASSSSVGWLAVRVSPARR